MSDVQERFIENHTREVAQNNYDTGYKDGLAAATVPDDGWVSVEGLPTESGYYWVTTDKEKVLRMWFDGRDFSPEIRRFGEPIAWMKWVQWSPQPYKRIDSPKGDEQKEQT